MKAVRLYADWKPRPGFKLGSKDIDGKLSYLGSRVWRNPRIKVEDMPVPEVGPTEVLIKVRACGICGSDVHMFQADEQGYIFYPGLTAFPATLGHEFSGEVVEAGREAFSKRTGKPFRAGEAVTSEEMLWCSSCRPCADGQPNHCERLQELGFSCDGAYAEYIKVDSRYVWSLESLRERYPGDKLFQAGSLVEPTSVAFNAVIERGGGIRPGDNVVILGGGPIGLAACAILRRAGAAHVILSEPSEGRARLGLTVGATEWVNPVKESAADRILEITEGQGAKLFLEATGLPHVVWPEIERVIWEGRQINSVAVIVARADAKIQVTGEVFQVRKAAIVGSQGHSGHANFPLVISSMASGMDMTPLITKTIRLDEVEANLKLLQTDREECKISVVP
jgi:threonine dehydrogenase-like Zn-dependent dehydrogenase